MAELLAMLLLLVHFVVRDSLAGHAAYLRFVFEGPTPPCETVRCRPLARQGNCCQPGGTLPTWLLFNGPCATGKTTAVWALGSGMGVLEYGRPRSACGPYKVDKLVAEVIRCETLSYAGMQVGPRHLRLLERADRQQFLIG